MCAVVKADAYGHGAVECSRALQAEGAKWLGVTSLDEAIPLREAGIESRILLMTGFWRGEESEIVRSRLTPTVWEPWHIESLETAAALGAVRHAVHLKVDTGMGRLGVSLDQLPAVLNALGAAPHLVLEGLSTHLASSEIMDAPSVAEQERRFEEALRMVRAAGFDPSLIHMANTSALISRRETWNNMVRPGIAVYGYYLPFQRAGREVSGGTLRLPVKPVLTWKTRILSMRNFAANQPLGYGGTYVTKAPAHVAVLPVGYADGLRRQLSGSDARPGGWVILHSRDGSAQRAPIAGRVTMNLTMVDVTAIPGVHIGDEVVVLGDGITADDHARLAATIPYEILCAVRAG